MATVEMTLPRLCAVSGERALVEGLAEQSFDDGLTADVEFFGEAVEFVQHGGGEVDIDALDGLHAAAGVGEEPGDVLARIRQAGNGFGGDWFLLTRCVFHKVCALPRWPSKGSPDGRTRLRCLPESRK